MSARQYLLEDGIFDIRLSYLRDRLCLYRPFLRPQTVDVMNDAIFSERFGGATDVSALSVLVMFSSICQPTRVLELGTYQGFSTLILADILSSNSRPGRIVTVEPSQESQSSASAHPRGGRARACCRFRQRILARGTSARPGRAKRAI